MVTLIHCSRWIRCLWSVLSTRPGTGCSFHWAIDLPLSGWFYLNPCLWPCPLCFGSTLHFAKRSRLLCSVAAFFSLKSLPRGQSCKLYPSSILIHHLHQAAESLQRLKQNQLCFFLESLAQLAMQTLSTFNYVWADYPVANEPCYTKNKTLLFPSLTFSKSLLQFLLRLI